MTITPLHSLGES